MQHKQVFGRMNQDSDVRALKPGEYRFLRNGINVQGTTIKAFNDAITSIYGNAVLTNAAIEANSVVVGFLEDRVNNRAFFAVYNSNNNHTIYQISSAFVVSTVLRTSIFGFGATDYVDMDILGDILVLSNGTNEIKKINITDAAAGNYGTVTEEKITLLKRAPHYPLEIKKSNDSGFGNDFLAGVFVFMTYRYVYEDNEISVWAPPAFAPHFVTTQQNRVGYTIPSSETIPTTVQRIDFAAWLNDSTELVIFESKDISGGTPPSIDYFYNKTGTTSDDAGSVKWNDSVPLKAKSVKFFENRLFTFNNTEGFAISKTKLNNFIVTESPISAGFDSDALTTGQSVSALQSPGVDVVWDNDGFMQSNIFTVPDDCVADISVDLSISSVTWSIPGQVIQFDILKNGVTIGTSSNLTEPTTSGTISLTLTSVSLLFGDQIKVRVKSVDPGATFTVDSGTSFEFTISSSNTLPLKNRGLYSVAIAFFDKLGRLVGLREAENQVDVPDRDESTLTISDVYTIGWDLSTVAQADIPLSAYYYTLLKTKCLNVSYFLTSRTSDIFFYKKASDGTYTYNKTYSDNNTGMAIDISHLADQYQQGYTLNTGDRIFIYNSDSTTKDFIIRSQDGRFLYVDNYNLPGISAAPTNRYFEIYTPKSPSVNEPFYEAMFMTGGYICTAKMAITNPATGSRAFSILTASASSNASKRLIGDCVFDDGFGFGGLRTSDYTYVSGGYSSTAPYTNTRQTLTRGPVIAMNYLGPYWDKWIQAVGKRAAIVPLVDGVEVNKYAALRFSQPYIQNSLVNGLNTFEALDEYLLPLENGEGVLLAEAGDVLVGLHKIESTAIYVGDGFVNTSSGSSFLSKTDSVIGDDRRYLGGHGTTHPASVVSRDSRVYFYDSRKGCIVRRSQDGLTVISEYGIKGFISYLATLHNADSGNSRIVAGWDPQYDCYCISFFLTGGSYNFTLYFHEKTNSWVCVSDLMPIRFGTLNQYQLAFASGGGAWKQSPEANYNNFFNTAYSRRIEWEFGSDSLMKILEAIEVDAESIYSTAGTNEEIVSVYLEEGGTKQTQINYLDFTQREGVWRSPFFNMITDVNFGSALESKKKSPYKVRGQSFYMVMVYNGTDKNLLKSITSFFRPKMLSNP